MIIGGKFKGLPLFQAEFAKQVGISTSTISEWKKRKTNPTVEKIMDICNVLQITPEQLLTGKGIEDEEEIVAASPESKFIPVDKTNKISIIITNDVSILQRV